MDKAEVEFMAKHLMSLSAEDLLMKIKIWKMTHPNETKILGVLISAFSCVNESELIRVIETQNSVSGDLKEE